MQPFRIEPAMPPSAYKTYSIAQPSDVTVKTACEDAGCLAHSHGWRTAIDESTSIGRAQAHYIRQVAKRTYREQRDGALTVFTFEPGQRCFAEHRTRPEIYSVTGGDGRIARTSRPMIRAHTRAADWQEDMQEHQMGLADRLARG